MRYFNIKKVINKLLFCSTQCICIKRWLLRRNNREIYDASPNMEGHPIFDLEIGEL